MQPIHHIQSSFTPHDEILNTALSLSLEWGENFNKPIHERLKLRYPHLWEQEIDQFNRSAQHIKYDSFRLFDKELQGEISLANVHLQIRQLFPGISENNLNMLTTQGMYYARR